MMQPQGTPAMPMPGQAPQQGANTVTIDMTPGAITVTSAQGTKQCSSIGECLQAVLEMYESMSGEGEGEGGEAALMAGYSGDSQPQARPPTKMAAA